MMSTGSLIIDLVIWGCMTTALTWYMNRSLDRWRGPAVDRPDLPYFIIWFAIVVPSFLWVLVLSFIREWNRVF